MLVFTRTRRKSRHHLHHYLARSTIDRKLTNMDGPPKLRFIPKQRFRRPVKKPGQKLTADDIDQLNFVTRYLGPEINKNSTFAPRKRRRDAEAKALKQADVLKNMHGQERAEEHMRKFYEERQRRKTADDRLLGRVKPTPSILDTLRRRNFQDPTPIQQAAIPIALSSRDIIGVAKTGSGKTLAFVLPLLVYILQLPPLTEYNMSDGPYALILAPTRELAQQIEKEAKAFADPLGFSVVCIVGGHSLEQQALALQAGAHIIVATPGRLVDCIENQFVVFHRCSYLVMDEADRMIDMGFEEPVNRILSALPSVERTDPGDGVDLPGWSMPLAVRGGARQTMMFTATMSPRVEKIAAKYMRQPAVVTIGSSDEAVDTVEQRVEFVAGEAKRLNRLQEVLSDPNLKSPVIIFVNVKHNCDAVAKSIRKMGWSTATLHSGKTQQQREAALKDAREGRTDVLVATDLAGRGIDVPDVSLVINFNMANSIESYTHRIGRTGRADDLQEPCVKGARGPCET
ncbi:unnamed protein product [Parascedosporium putredinis]|uniref:RNA helicase n=1 Tax=Parascedosporium putredinis TaxID=1442378 RepID=A0A9P1MAR5_9PEZI|nr:unnamed protein product [Parascedosporium putredinis]CAI7998135.1 unnamed protein product [Parascedosporium putredinis]